MPRIFEYVCKPCIIDAKESGEYKGVVNLDFRPLFYPDGHYKIFLRHFCFTCKREEIEELDTRKFQTVYTKNKFKKQIKKRYEAVKN